MKVYLVYELCISPSAQKNNTAFRKQNVLLSSGEKLWRYLLSWVRQKELLSVIGQPMTYLTAWEKDYANLGITLKNIFWGNEVTKTLPLYVNLCLHYTQPSYSSFGVHTLQQILSFHPTFVSFHVYVNAQSRITHLRHLLIDFHNVFADNKNLVVSGAL
jgi:hypothetical protein